MKIDIISIQERRVDHSETCKPGTPRWIPACDSNLACRNSMGVSTGEVGVLLPVNLWLNQEDI